MDILQVLAQLGITIPAATAAAYGAFKLLSKKWLDARFAERLEKFRHDQNQEMERLRYRINTLMDRTMKLHQHEFEVLPEAWRRLLLSYNDTLRFTSRIREFPSPEQMNEQQFLEFIENSRLANWEKEELRQLKSGDRNKRYIDMISGMS